MSKSTRKRATSVRRAPAVVRPKISGRVVPELSLWNAFQRIGGGVTPQTVSSIMRDADKGRMAQLVDLANDMRQKDCHLQGILDTNETCIAGLPWDLELCEDAKATERKAAEWAKEILRNAVALHDAKDQGIIRSSFAAVLAHHAGAVFYGYAVTEIEWAKRDGDIVPAAYHRLSPRRFGYAEVSNRFVWNDQSTNYQDVDFLAENPRRFITSHPRVNGDIPCREGLVRPLMWASLFRNWTMTDWLKLAELAWKPWRLGKYKKTASREDIEHLMDVLEAMSTNAVATYPETTEVQIEWPKASGSAQSQGSHGDLFRVVGDEMSKAVLGQTETTQASSSSGYAQAKVHNQVRQDLRDSRAKAVAEDITRDLIVPLIELNWGPNVRPPRFTFLTQEAVDFLAFAKGVQTFRTAGTIVPDAWVRDQAGIPEPGPEDMPKPEAEQAEPKPDAENPVEDDAEEA